MSQPSQELFRDLLANACAIRTDGFRAGSIDHRMRVGVGSQQRSIRRAGCSLEKLNSLDVDVHIRGLLCRDACSRRPNRGPLRAAQPDNTATAAVFHLSVYPTSARLFPSGTTQSCSASP